MKNQFEKNIQKAMHNHELPVSNSVWASVQNTSSKKSLIFYISRISVACLLLLLGLNTYNNNYKSRTSLDSIIVENKTINRLHINHTNELKKSYAKILPLESKAYKANNKKLITKQEISITQKEVIVLNIKTKKKRQTRINLKTRQKTQVNSEILLTQIENKLQIQDKKNLEYYLTDIKKLASKHTINNKIQTAQNWIVKQHPILETLTKKRKNND